MTRYITPEENQKRALEYRILRSEIKSNHPYRDRGITQDVLARELGVDVKTVRRRENAEFIVTNEALLAIRYVKHLCEERKSHWQTGQSLPQFPNKYD
jgi:DNA-binding transcriptional regulator YiaG